MIGKKILLVNTNMEKFPYPVPPLGLCLLAGVLETEYIVQIYDGVFDEGKNYLKTIEEFNPDIIGLSLRNIDNMVFDNRKSYIDDVNKIFVKPIKDVSKAITIIGGSGFSIFPNELMQYFETDYGVIGEAEETLPILLKYIENNLDVSQLKNVIQKNGDNKISNSFISLASDTKLVNESLIYNRIDFSLYRERGVYSIQTKRGCHHQCIYCTYPIIEGCNYRLRNAVDIVNEIENAHKSLGNITFEFVDSTFNDPAGHAESICKEIIKRKLKINLRTMGINPAHSSKELFDLMLNAGFGQIDSTPDSASPKIIKILKKNFSFEQLKKTALLIKESDIPTMWFFLFGAPQENNDTVNETFDFISKFINPNDMVHMTVGLRIYPNTELQRIAIKEEVIKATDSLLKTTFYVSNEIGKEALDEVIKKFSLEFSNCIPASESTPSKEMMQMAMKMRKEENLQEPMFRTLMRVKRMMK